MLMTIDTGFSYIMYNFKCRCAPRHYQCFQINKIDRRGIYNTLDIKREIYKLN